MQIEPPTIDAIRANRARLGNWIITTPVRQLVDDALAAAVGAATQVWLKEELFQRTGSFKPRGALSVMLDLDAAALARGVTGVSAGNHAISLGYSARQLGTTAKVVMPRSANPYRVQVCRDLGVAVELVDNVHQAFARVKEIEASEGRTFVHPYEGPKTALGTASVGLEFIDQVRAAGAALDAVIVAAGGGGLTAGVACAVKQMSPQTARLRGRARRRRHPQPQLCGRLAAGHRRRAHDRRLPRRAALRALLLCAQPAFRRRRGAGQRRADPRRDAAAVPRRQARRRAGRRCGAAPR